ncbi:MAG: serine/threonine protein kinase [Gemmata sp.]
MSVPASVDELLQLIRKSGMVDEGKLSAYLQHRQLARGLPDDPREFSDDLVNDGILTYFQAEQFLLGKWRGFTIGKFKLLERIGVGGMGQVFLCEHMFMKRRVAVKVLPPAKAEQPAALGRFYREARAAGSLDHTNIIRTHDIDQDGNLHFIVMDYVDGPNLLDVVKKFGPLDITRAVSYIRQAALGLDYAFRNKLIHRDVKPGNILIDRKGVARILDMGLARFLNDHSDQLTIKYDDKIVLGTADYVAPEQVANSHSVDIRADVYGLGATFYFLLAGHPPFPTGTVSQKLLWHRTKEPTPVVLIRPEVPEAVAAIIGKMMAKDPKARYQTPAQVVAELEQFLTGPVPLPAAEEMPLLSPAATEGIVEEDVAGAAVAETPLNTAATLAAHTQAKFGAGAAVMSPLAASPFGASTNSPWGTAPRSSAVVTRPAPRGVPPRPSEPADAQTAKRPGRFSPVNPFAADAVAARPAKKLHWGVVVGALAAAVVVALVLAKVI